MMMAENPRVTEKSNENEDPNKTPQQDDRRSCQSMVVIDENAGNDDDRAVDKQKEVMKMRRGKGRDPQRLSFSLSGRRKEP